MRFKVQNLNSIDELKKYSIYLYKTELVIYLGYNKYTHAYCFYKIINKDIVKDKNTLENYISEILKDKLYLYNMICIYSKVTKYVKEIELNIDILGIRSWHMKNRLLSNTYILDLE